MVCPHLPYVPSSPYAYLKNMLTRLPTQRASGIDQFFALSVGADLIHARVTSADATSQRQQLLFKAPAYSAVSISIHAPNAYACGGYPENEGGCAGSAHVHEHGYVHQSRSTQTNVRAGDAHRERGDAHASAACAGARARGFQ